MAVQDYKINYKSDFVLNINGDAGWAVPFCIKFWTGMPSQAYFVGFDGVKYVNCRVGDTPTQLLVMFDDHHLPIGPLKMQIAYHTTIEEFPGSVFDEVTNARDVIVTIDGTDYQVLLDFTGEDAPELEFDLPAYANESERIQNELQRQQNEADRIAAELQREQATAAAVQGAENVNAQLNGTTLTVTNRQGVSTSVNTKGEPGAQGPVGPEGQQGEQGPKGEKGDTGATGPQGIQGPAGPQGQTGVSITDFVKTGETETDTLYDIEFSNDTTKPVAIPKGEKGDQGEQGPEGPQGPMGDVAVITPEQQAAFTMYSTTGQNTDGPMTQKAVTDTLIISISPTETNKAITTNGDTIGAVITKNATNWCYAKYAVNEGDVVMISGTGGNSPRLWAIADVQENILSKEETINATREDFVFVMPAGAKWIVLNNNGNEYPDYKWCYAKAGSVGAHEMLTGGYLYGDLKTLAVGQTYDKNEAVKTTDRQLLRVTKEIQKMNLVDEVSIGDLKAVTSGNELGTYQALKAVTTYTGDDSSYNDGDYAIGSFSEYTLTVVAGNAEGNVKVNGTVIAISEGETAAEIAATIAEDVDISGWTLSADGSNVIVKCNTVGNNTTIITFNDSDNTGVTISGNTTPSTAGNSVVRVYDGSVWTDAVLADYAADSSVWESKDLAWLSDFDNGVVVQNTIQSHIDAATIVWGEEMFKPSEYSAYNSNKNNVKTTITNGTVKLTSVTANKGTIGIVGQIQGLVIGQRYKITFDYKTTMGTAFSSKFGTGSVNSNNNFIVSAQDPTFFISEGSEGHADVDYVCVSDNKYLMFGTTTGAKNTYTEISNIHIRQYGTALEAIPKAIEAYDVSKSNYDAIHDVQQSTVRTEGYEYFGGASSPNVTTRIRVLYNCKPHCRVTLSYSGPDVLTGECDLMSSYNISTGGIDSSNRLDYLRIYPDTDYKKEWDITGAKYILINMWNRNDTTATISAAQVEEFMNGLNIVIEDVEGYDGLDKRVTDLEEKEESESAVNINMIFGTNVKDCGAKGDGIADDTNALQMALNKRGTIYIPNGTYLITNSLAMYSNTHIIMDKGTVIKRNIDARFCIFYSYYTANTTLYNGEHDITIEGGILDLGTGYTYGGCGLGFQHCQNITIRDVTIKHVTAGYHCIDCGGSKNVRIENCIFTDHTSNALSAEMVQIDRTAFGSFPIPANYPPQGSACYDNTGCENVEITGCKFYTNSYSPAIGNHSQEAVHSRINIHDNILIGNGTTISDYRGAIAFANANNNMNYVYIHDNTIQKYAYGFQFVPDKPFYVKNNILIDIDTLERVEDGQEGHGVYDNNIQIATT